MANKITGQTTLGELQLLVAQHGASISLVLDTGLYYCTVVDERPGAYGNGADRDMISALVIAFERYLESKIQAMGGRVQ